MFSRIGCQMTLPPRVLASRSCPREDGGRESIPVSSRMRGPIPLSRTHMSFPPPRVLASRSCVSSTHPPFCTHMSFPPSPCPRRLPPYAGTHPPFCTHMSFPPPRVLACPSFCTDMSFPPTPCPRDPSPFPAPTCHSPPPRVLASRSCPREDGGRGPIPLAFPTHMSFPPFPCPRVCPSPFLHPHVIPPHPVSSRMRGPIPSSCPRRACPREDGGRESIIPLTPPHCLHSSYPATLPP